MLKIDYDAVAIDIQDYIIDICMVTTDLLEKYKALDEIDPTIFIIQLGIYKHITFHLDDDGTAHSIHTLIIYATYF